MRPLIAILKLMLFAIWSFCMVSIQLVILLFSRGKIAYLTPYIWHHGVCKIFRVTVTTSGEIAPPNATLYISNHMSWIDIPVIGSVLKASFVAKREVASWPIFGFLSKLQQTAFIDRNRRSALKEKDSLKNKLETGKSLILFPEGTSSDGSSVLPFKSSLFELAKGEKDITLQPFSITIQGINKQPVLTQKQRDLYAWHGDMDLAPHLWTFAQQKHIHIHLDFLSPLEITLESQRKEISNHAYQLILSSFTSHGKFGKIRNK